MIVKDLDQVIKPVDKMPSKGEFFFLVIKRDRDYHKIPAVTLVEKSRAKDFYKHCVVFVETGNLISLADFSNVDVLGWMEMN